MSLQNGQIVLLALSRLRRKSTLRQVAAEVASCLHLATVSDSMVVVIKDTLEAGVRIGYIRKTNTKYYELCISAENIKFMTRTKDAHGGVPEEL